MVWGSKKQQKKATERWQAGFKEGYKSVLRVQRMLNETTIEEATEQYKNGEFDFEESLSYLRKQGYSLENAIAKLYGGTVTFSYKGGK